jgi:uncharacterized protein YndB with AHSA1/START domain
MKLTATTELRISRTPHEVFEAIVDPAKMSHYFITWASARPEPGKVVTWKWEDVGAEGKVKVLEVEQDRRFAFTWDVGGDDKRVDITVEPDDDGAAAVHVSDGPYEPDEAGIAAFRGQLQGWTHFLLCLKAYIEYGVELRVGSITRAHRDEIAKAQREAVPS